jgi:hypothetical protein
MQARWYEVVVQVSVPAWCTREQAVREVRNRLKTTYDVEVIEPNPDPKKPLRYGRFRVSQCLAMRR